MFISAEEKHIRYSSKIRAGALQDTQNPTQNQQEPANTKAEYYDNK